MQQVSCAVLRTIPSAAKVEMHYLTMSFQYHPLIRSGVISKLSFYIGASVISTLQ